MFAETIDRLLGSADAAPLSLLIVDLDRFKAINDTSATMRVMRRWSKRLDVCAASSVSTIAWRGWAGTSSLSS